MRLWKSKTSRQNLITLASVLIVFSVVYVLNNNGVLSRSLSGQLIPICVYIIMALSLNLTVGILGELSLGHAGFMSVGAFSGVIAVAFLGNYIGNPVLLMAIAIVIGGLLAYPVAVWLMGVPAASVTFYAYIVPFLISTVAGAVLAGVIVFALEKNGALSQMQNKL